MHRNKLRHLGLKQLSPQQVQVNLDHDYCSSNRTRRNRPNQYSSRPEMNVGNGGLGGRHQILQAALRSPIVPKRQGLNLKTSSVLAPSKTVIRVPSTPNIPHARLKAKNSNLISLERSLSQECPPVSSHLSKTSVLSLKRSISARLNNHDKVIRVESPIPLASSTSTIVVSQRRDSDPKKDSGLESGEVSDASNNDENDAMYSRLPSYLTSNIKTESRDDSLYDRLPAYVTGISRSSSERNLPNMPATSDDVITGEVGGNPGGQLLEKKVALPVTISTESRVVVHCDNSKPSDPMSNGVPSKRLLRSRKRPRARTSSSSSATSTSSSTSSSSSSTSGSDSSSQESRKKKNSTSFNSKHRTVQPVSSRPSRTSPRKAVAPSNKRDRSPSTSSSESGDRVRSRSPIARRRSSRKR